MSRILSKGDGGIKFSCLKPGDMIRNGGSLMLIISSHNNPRNNSWQVRFFNSRIKCFTTCDYSMNEKFYNNQRIQLFSL